MKPNVGVENEEAISYNLCGSVSVQTVAWRSRRLQSFALYVNNVPVHSLAKRRSSVLHCLRKRTELIYHARSNVRGKLVGEMRLIFITAAE